MTRKRTKLQIIYDILRILMLGEINPTKLATLVNMPYDRLMNLLKEMNEKGLVKIVSTGKTKTVGITHKGVELYEELKKIVELLNDYGLL
jgi:predicted transcriptional regulator